MNRSRRKNWNTVDAASLARWIVLTAFLALTGLIYVYLTLQLYHLGDRKKALENELASLRTQNDVASVQIAALTSRSALQRRLKEGYLKMIPISEHNIVRLTIPARSTAKTPFNPWPINVPADEVEQPDSLRAGLPRLHRALQRFFLPIDLSADDQARRVRRARR